MRQAEGIRSNAVERQAARPDMVAGTRLARLVAQYEFLLMAGLA